MYCQTDCFPIEPPIDLVYQVINWLSCSRGASNFYLEHNLLDEPEIELRWKHVSSAACCDIRLQKKRGLDQHE